MRKSAILLVILAFASISSALTITETLTFSFPLSPGSQILDFAQFDDASGTLQLETVTLELNLTEQANVTGENDSAIPGSMAVNLSGNGTASGLGLSAVVALSETTPSASVTATDGVPDSGTDYHDFGTVSDSGSDSDMLHYLIDNLSAFIGTGTVAIDIDASGGFSISGVTDSTLKISNFGASGNAKMTYGYSTIPEPATLSILGLGGLMLIRKKK